MSYMGLRNRHGTKRSDKNHHGPTTLTAGMHCTNHIRPLRLAQSVLRQRYEVPESVWGFFRSTDSEREVQAGTEFIDQ
jgi:hypothetical protein